MQPVTPETITSAERPTIDELPAAGLGLRLTIWQSPFIQSVMPFLTSLLVHVAIIVLGIATIQVGARIVGKPVAIFDQTLTPEAPADDIQQPESKLAKGTPDGDDRPPGQMDFPDASPESSGINNKPGTSLANVLSNGVGENDDNVIGIGGAASRISHGPINGTGSSGGPLAPFGPPGTSNWAPFIGRGPRVQARSVVFVCDATGSMMPMFDLLRAELAKSINILRMQQSLNVVFFQENARPPIDPGLLSATPENKRRLLKFVDDYICRGPTDPKPALKAAFAMQPQLIYFLCDPGDFPDPQGTINMCKDLNQGGKTKIITIAFENHDDDGEKTLKQIAADSGGQFRFVSSHDLEK